MLHRPGRSGACDRYANLGGELGASIRVVLDARGAAAARWCLPRGEWDGSSCGAEDFVTGIGAGTTYPDYKPAPFIVSAEIDGVDMVTVVTEGSSAIAA